MPRLSEALPGYKTHTNLTAIHEAGHAVAALQQGFCVEAVPVDIANPECGSVL